jgi:hypothetical protein
MAASQTSSPALLGTVISLLTFAFLASTWFLKACAEQIYGRP